MKKFISVLLCLALLFSFGALAAAQEAPQLSVVAYGPVASENPNSSMKYVCFSVKLENCPDFDNLQMLIRYNPDVLKLVKGYPFLLDEEHRKQTICTVQEPGVVLVTGNNCDCGNNEFDPFCFKIIGSGDTDISVELVSFKTADGEVEDVVFEAGIANFTAVVEAPQLNISTSKYLAADVGELFTFELSLQNCIDFESLDLLITYNPAVMKFTTNCPFVLTNEYRYDVSCVVVAPGKMRVLVYNRESISYASKGKIIPFGFEIIGSGDTDVAVELLSFRYTDGEVENVAINANIQNYTVTESFVKYDINKDFRVAAEDARQALRFAVGLDTATDAQCRAAGVDTTNDFTAELARTILRKAVGLEP